MIPSSSTLYVPYRVPTAAQTRSGMGFAEDESGRVDRVHSHVHQRTAAGERGIDEPAFRAPAGMDAVSAGLDDLTELAGRDPVAHRDHVRVEPPTMATISQAPPRWEASIIASHSATETAIGFSTSTCLPAPRKGDRLLGVERVGGGDR
jgi:hypothetical protein